MHFLTEQSIAYGGLFGEVALLGTFAALAPEQSWALLDAVQNGRHAEAAEIGSWFERLNHTVFDPLMVDRRVDGAYDKTIEKLAKGMADFPLRMLSPYRTVSELEFEETPGRRLCGRLPGARVIVDSHVYCFVAPDEPAGPPERRGAPRRGPGLPRAAPPAGLANARSRTVGRPPPAGPDAGRPPSARPTDVGVPRRPDPQPADLDARRRGPREADLPAEPARRRVRARATASARWTTPASTPR